MLYIVEENIVDFKPAKTPMSSTEVLKINNGLF